MLLDRRPRSSRSGGEACRVDARDDCMDVVGGLVDVGGSEAELFGKRSVGPGVRDRRTCCRSTGSGGLRRNTMFPRGRGFEGVNPGLGALRRAPGFEMSWLLWDVVQCGVIWVSTSLRARMTGGPPGTVIVTAMETFS
jgi:hypothetical protein